MSAPAAIDPPSSPETLAPRRPRLWTFLWLAGGVLGLSILVTAGLTVAQASGLSRAPAASAASWLFFAGVAFCYFFVFGVVFKFVYSIAPKSIEVAPDIENYFSFVLGMFFAFGVTFEVPIAVVLLVKMRMVTVAKLKEIRPYVVVGAFVVAAVVTPPDVISQIMLAIPLWLLYEAGIIVSTFIEKPAPQQAESSG